MPDLVYHADPAADGPANMAADERLCEALPPGGASLRWYAWTAPTVSLGAFQRAADWRESPPLSGMPVVRRPSGGGAILHGSDLTYAIAVSRSHPAASAPRLLYDAVHEAAVDLIGELGLAASMVPPGKESGADRFLCFHRRTEGDVVIAGHKVLGSSQRRLRQAVLQHGSLLVGSASDLVDAWPESWERLPGLGAFLAKPIDGDRLREAWTLRIAQRLGLDAVRASVAPDGRGLSALDPGRYATHAWTWRR
jgi:lipoate-protein ligase A